MDKKLNWTLGFWTSFGTLELEKFEKILKNYFSIEKPRSLLWLRGFCGADSQIRTGDLILTNSFSSVFIKSSVLKFAWFSNGLPSCLLILVHLILSALGYELGYNGVRVRLTAEESCIIMFWPSAILLMKEIALSCHVRGGLFLCFFQYG